MTQLSELHDASSKPWTQLSSFAALVFLLLTQNCSGLPQVVGPSQPVLAMVGGDALLSCRLEPAVDASGMSIEWSREDLDPSYVYVWWDREELESSKHSAYNGRTSLLVSKLEFGDVSLKLSKVKPSDEGKYRCFIPTLGRGSTVELVVGIDPFTVISLAGLDRTSSSVELQCESAGWYPEPEVLWLDGDGNLLSAGPTKTVRGHDELYTISSRVTVEKRHDNKFTCRVQQNNIKQTREALIQVADDFFEAQSSYTSTIDNLSVTVAVAIILFIFFFVNTMILTRKRKTLEKTVEQLKEIKRKFLDEKLKSLKTEGKLKTVIQNMIKELDEINFDTNSDPTGSDEKNQQKESEKFQDEKQKWMKTVENLKTELQNMNQELELTGAITLEEVSELGRYIRLKNISTEFSELHDASSKPWTQLSSFTALVFLLLTQSCSGLSQVVGPSQPILATAGNDVLLSCRLEPAVDASGMSIEWSREDLDPRYVYVWWDREEMESSKHRDYKGRTSLLFSKLEFGDVSLKLSSVKASDKGKYRCFIPTLGEGSSVELVVGDFFMSQSSYILTIVSLVAAIILLILAVVLFVRTRKLKKKIKMEKQQELDQMKKECGDVRNRLIWEKQKSEALNSHLKKWTKTGRKQKTVIQNKIKELDEINFDTNSDPTGSDEKNQQEELKKLQDEKQKWMETVENLKTELQTMDKELKLIGSITVEEVDKEGYYIRLKNISSEEIKLGGWELKLQINNNEPEILMFDESSKLQPEGILCLRSPNWSGSYLCDVDVVWSGLIPWLPDDTLQMKLTSNYGEIFRLF